MNSTYPTITEWLRYCLGALIRNSLGSVSFYSMLITAVRCEGNAGWHILFLSKLLKSNFQQSYEYWSCLKTETTRLFQTLHSMCPGNDLKYSENLSQSWTLKFLNNWNVKNTDVDFFFPISSSWHELSATKVEGFQLHSGKTFLLVGECVHVLSVKHMIYYIEQMGQTNFIFFTHFLLKNLRQFRQFIF